MAISRRNLELFIELRYSIQLFKLIISIKNFFWKTIIFRRKIAFCCNLLKKGLTTSKRRGPPSWDPSQMKELIFGFLKMVYMCCGKLWKKSCGVLKWDRFSKRAIFQNFYSSFYFDDSYESLNKKKIVTQWFLVPLLLIYCDVIVT